MSENEKIEEGQGQEKALVPVDKVTGLIQRPQDLMELSASLLASKMLPNTFKTPEAVAAIILRGQELGIGPMEALTSIHVIGGRVVSATQLMLALVYRSGELRDIVIERGDPVTVTVTRKGFTPHTASFGSEDAKRARLHNKDNYRKWPETMYMWRAVAMALRVVFPDVVGSVYSPEETGVEMRSDVVDGDWRPADLPQFREAEEDPIDSEIIDSVLYLHSEGHTVSHIAREVEISIPEVRRILDEYVGEERIEEANEDADSNEG